MPSFMDERKVFKVWNDGGIVARGEAASRRYKLGRLSAHDTGGRSPDQNYLHRSPEGPRVQA